MVTENGREERAEREEISPDLLSHAAQQGLYKLFEIKPQPYSFPQTLAENVVRCLVDNIKDRYKLFSYLFCLYISFILIFISLKARTKEDTWGSEELTKHLKASDLERHHDVKRNKVKGHHRDLDKEELVERRRKHSDRERTDEKDSQKHAERDRYVHREKEAGKDHRSEKARDPERDRRAEKEKHESDRHKVREREKGRERKYSGGDPAKLSSVPRVYGEGEMTREEKEQKRREMRDSQENAKRRSDDRERRHRERREKEWKSQEKDYEDGDSRRRKHREDLDSQDLDRERRRSDRKQRENAEREKLHRNHQDPSLGSSEQSVRQLQEQAKPIHRVKERSSREKASDDTDKEKRHREKREKRSQPSEDRRDITEMKKEETSDPANHADTIYEDPTNYEEDFEDYDDDFEEESDNGDEEPVRKEENLPIFKSPEIEDIQRAMILENENISLFPSAENRKIPEPEPKSKEWDLPSKGSHRGIFIDFGSAKQRQVNRQLGGKMKKRSADILRLVDLDFSSTVSLLDLAPVKEYDLYIRNFGKTNTKQAYVQCNEDCVEREIQTEDVESEEKWTQHPAEGTVACGSHKSDETLHMDPLAKMDAQRLTGFLRSACQVMAVLLEEDRAERQSEWKVQSKEPCMSFSESCYQLDTNLPFLQDRSVYQLRFSEAQRHLLLSVHGCCRSHEPTPLANKCIMCLWNVWEPSTPQKVLTCESQVTCCCFSPGKVSLVFAGTADGSVVVWDLREDISLHHTVTLADTSWTFRSATFSTDGVFTKVNHSSPITAVETVLSAAYKEHGMASLSSQEEVSSSSFQIATLDETGHLILWVVVELRKKDMSGSQNDLGLIPGGKVKLAHSSSILLTDSFFPKDVSSLGPVQTTNIKFLPQDSNQFFVGTDIGIVTHGTRYGLTEPPKHYKPLRSKIRPSQVTAIDFSPFDTPAFLAGCSDGCIRLHRTSSEFPDMQWNHSTNGQSISALQWSLTRPTVFFVMDAACCLYIWDLLQNDLQPVARDSVLSDQIISMAVLGEPEKNNALMGLAVSKTSGKVEIQYIKKKWAKPQPKDKLDLILH
ncbi:cytoplasmic dynein 2 intermediate chain 1 [Pelodytes ibericus]